MIPYGSKVVINGQVYVAEDCGGAIKKNRIDIYVATHAEGEAKGTYDTEVYSDKINKRQEPENSGYPAFNHLVISKGKIIYLAMA